MLAATTAWRAMLPSVLLLALAGCSNGLQEQQESFATSVVEQPPESAKAVTVKDDTQDKAAIFSTEKVSQERRSPDGTDTQRQYLRAFLDKATGTRRYQVVVSMTYKSDRWRDPYQATFGTPLATHPTSRVSRKNNCLATRPYGCHRIEQVTFELPESEFVRVVTKPSPEEVQSTKWTFKLKNRDGQDYAGELPLDEFAGLQSAMNAHKPVASR